MQYIFGTNTYLMEETISSSAKSVRKCVCVSDLSSPDPAPTTVCVMTPSTTTGPRCLSSLACTTP